MNITYIKLSNFLGIQSLEIEFELPARCIFLTTFEESAEVVNTTHAIMNAMKFLIHPNFIEMNRMNITSKSEPNGFVKIKFQNCESNVNLIAKRTILDPSMVELLEDGSEESVQNKINIYEFQKKYFNIVHNFHGETKNDGKNLLQFYFDEIFTADKLYSDCTDERSGYKDMLNTDVEYNPAISDIIIKYNKALNLIKEMQKVETPKCFSNFLAVSKLTDIIFQKITNKMIGTIHFFVGSDADSLSKLLDATNENFHCNTLLITVLKLYRDGKELIVWCNLPEFLKILLIISANIAVAIKNEEKILFLDNINLNLLENAQNLEYAYAKMELNKNAIAEETEEKSWISNNYIQNIIDVCNENKVFVIMNYNAILKVKKAFRIIVDRNVDNNHLHPIVLNNSDIGTMKLPKYSASNQ